MEIEFHRRRLVVRWGEWMERVQQSRLLEGMEEREGPEQSQQIWFAFLSTFSTTLALSLSLSSKRNFVPSPPLSFVCPARVRMGEKGEESFKVCSLPRFFRRLRGTPAASPRSPSAHNFSLFSLFQQSIHYSATKANH